MRKKGVLAAGATVVVAAAVVFVAVLWTNGTLLRSLGGVDVESYAYFVHSIPSENIAFKDESLDQRIERLERIVYDLEKQLTETE